MTAATWPEHCEGRSLRCFRSYSLRQGDQLLALGRTQWAVLGEKGRLIPFAQSGFPEDFPFVEREGITEAPARFRDDLLPEELVQRHTVRSTDIDMGRHMNNVAYVRLLLDCFPASVLAGGEIASMEIHYASPCFEGEELSVLCRREGSIWSHGGAEARRQDRRTGCRPLSRKVSEHTKARRKRFRFLRGLFAYPNTWRMTHSRIRHRPRHAISRAKERLPSIRWKASSTVPT